MADLDLKKLSKRHPDRKETISILFGEKNFEKGFLPIKFHSTTLISEAKKDII